jgi:hypothetical protein
MRTWIALAFSLFLVGCNASSRDSVTFSCESKGGALSSTDRRVVFRYEGGFLFVKNDSGGTDNVCSQVGTVLCDVSMTDENLTLRQEIESPYCGWRPMVKTSLDIDRRSGAFLFAQEGCEPSADMNLTGSCMMRLSN